MKTGNRTRCIEWAVLIAAVALANLSLLNGEPAHHLIFLPAAVAGGEWWRIVTHPFAHVTPYHLALDAAAFFILYYGLTEHSMPRRMIYVVGAGAGSLLASLVAAPQVTAIGLCGLSGIAHGIMAISAIEFLVAERSSASRTPTIIAGACLVLVVGKSVVEALTGSVVFSSMHAGNIGTPIAVCHAGGVLGALLAYVATRARDLESRTISTAGFAPASI